MRDIQLGVVSFYVPSALPSFTLDDVVSASSRRHGLSVACALSLDNIDESRRYRFAHFVLFDSITTEVPATDLCFAILTVLLLVLICKSGLLRCAFLGVACSIIRLLIEEVAILGASRVTELPSSLAEKVVWNMVLFA